MFSFSCFQRNYLEQFGYLKKGQLEVGNLLLGNESQNYEDDFRIAIKTLQVCILNPVNESNLLRFVVT